VPVAKGIKPLKASPALLPFILTPTLSYVNQILDRKGVYKEGGAAKNPYQI